LERPLAANAATTKLFPIRAQGALQQGTIRPIRASSQETSLNRRTFIATIGLIAAPTSAGVRLSIADAGRPLAPVPDVFGRLLLRQIASAFRDLRSDRQILLAQACGVSHSDLDECLRSAFGIKGRPLPAPGVAELRRVYQARRDADLRAMRVIELDGHLLADSEYSLAKLLQVVDRA
jgi:hypothetical protein